MGKIKSKLEIKNKSGVTEVYIMGVIGWDFTEADLIEQLKGCEDKIDLYISSGGGSVFSGWAMMSALKRTGSDITAYIDGIAASMASGIAMVANKVIMSETGLFMLHNASGGVYGNKEDILKTAQVLEKIDNILIKTYVKGSGKTEKEITDMMATETWLTSQEALEHGVVDEIQDEPNPENCVGNCQLIAENKFNYKNIPDDKISEMKETMKVSDKNTMTKEGLSEMINSLKCKDYYNEELI